jgi:hypothetical protein
VRLPHPLVSALVALALAHVPAAAAAAPIPDTGGPTAANPAFAGSPAVQHPVYAPAAPRHPFMAPNERSNLHDDAYMTDTNATPGPLGKGITVRSTLLEGVCGSVTFDAHGRIVTVCVGAEGPKLELLDPRTLDSIAAMGLPSRQSVGVGLFNDFAGGGYFYLDNQDRAVIPTTTRHLFVVAVKGDTLVRERDYDLTPVVPNGDKIFSVLPDWSGRLWFVTAGGIVATLDPKTGVLKQTATHEAIANSFAVDEDGGVYVVTARAMYRFDAGASGEPVVTWREVYDNSGIAKPGQVGAGSGTTPTVMGRSWVAITDNADPMQVVVYKRARSVAGSRLVCEHAVFGKGQSDTDQSLIATRRSMIVENNYGYSGPAAVMNGKRTIEGLERVDVDRDGTCRTVWHSREIAPTVVPKLDLPNGLVYTYTLAPGSSDPWYLTALDFETGRTIYRALAGHGFGYNNNYAPVTIGPDGTAYVGVFGGLVSLADATVPPAARVPAPRLSLALRRSRAGRVRARLSGADVARVESVAYTAHRRAAAARRPPFSRLFGLRALGGPKVTTVVARVLMLDGRAVTLRRSIRRR